MSTWSGVAPCLLAVAQLDKARPRSLRLGGLKCLSVPSSLAQGAKELFSEETFLHCLSEAQPAKVTACFHRRFF